jgi:RNA polymerase sigma-70 factor (family 1)
MAFENLPDHLLLNKCQNGDINAYEILFEKYFGVLYDFSLKYIRNTVVAEELVMDLMLNIWLKRSELQIDGELANYLFGAMKNTVFNYLRKKELTTIPIEAAPELNAYQSMSADHGYSSRELEQVYQLKLAQLSPQRKKIFVLSREAEMTYPQIAEKMNISVNTVKSQMLASLKFFRETLKEHIDITMFALLFLLLRK